MYRYRGRTDKGELAEGDIEAANISDARMKLQTQGIIATAITAQKSKKHSDKAWSFGELKTESMWAKTVKPDDLILFCRQMYSLNKAGIPLIRAFTGLADSVAHPVLKEALFGVADGLKQGNDLATSMSAYPKLFSVIFISMIRMGESTGRVDLAFQQLVSYLELEKNTRRRIKKATNYPIIVICFLIIAILVVNVMVVPNFATIFAKFGSELPLPTRILMASSDFLINYWWLLIGGSVGSLVAWVYYIKSAEGELFKDKLKFRLPLIGDIIRKITMSRFTRPFAMMTNSGVPLLQALNIASKTVGNVYVGQAIEGMQRNIEQGESLVRAAAATGMFNAILLQMIAVGEETGQVGNMLLEISDFYDEEVDFSLETLQQRLEPIILLIIGFMVLILATGVFLPMWDLVNVVR